MICGQGNELSEKLQSSFKNYLDSVDSSSMEKLGHIEQGERLGALREQGLKFKELQTFFKRHRTGIHRRIRISKWSCKFPELLQLSQSKAIQFIRKQEKLERESLKNKT